MSVSEAAVAERERMALTKLSGFLSAIGPRMVNQRVMETLVRCALDPLATVPTWLPVSGLLRATSTLREAYDPDFAVSMLDGGENEDEISCRTAALAGQ